MKISNNINIRIHKINHTAGNKNTDSISVKETAEWSHSYPFSKSYYTDLLSFKSKSKHLNEKRIKELTELGIDEEYAHRIAGLDNKSYARAVYLFNEGVSAECIEDVIFLKPQNYRQALVLIKEGIYDSNLPLIASYNKADFEKALKLIKSGIDYYCINLFINLSDKEEKEANALMKQGFPPIAAANLTKLTPEQKTIAQNLFNSGVEIGIASEISQYNEEIRESCLALIRQGIAPEFVSEIAHISSDAAKKTEFLINLQIGDANIADFLGFNKKDYDRAIRMLKDNISPDFIKDIIDIEKGKTKNPEYEEYISRGYGKTTSFTLSLLSDKEIDALSELIKIHPEIKELLTDEYDISIVFLQNEDKAEVIMQKEMRTESGTKITLIRTYDGNKEKTTCRTEKYADNTSSSFSAGSTGVFKTEYSKNGEIKKLTEFVYDPETKAVTGVIITKESDLLTGAFESTYYDISQIKESNDEGINDISEEFAITGEGEPISKITKEADGTIKYTESFQMNQYFIDRVYTEKRDEKGNIIQSTYSYKIQDENKNEPEMTISRSYKRNPDDSVDNTINSINYHMVYDDTNKTITISDGERSRVLDMKQKLSHYSEDILWETIKQLPADILLTIYDNIKQWNYCIEEDSTACLATGTLSTGKNINIITHEAGHLQTNEDKSILNDEEFIQAYGEEMESFKLSIPYNEQSFITYFSPRADLTGSEGDSEFAAESNILLTSYGTAYKRIKTRTQFLEKYFPRTIARIAHLTGKTSSESLLK